MEVIRQTQADFVLGNRDWRRSRLEAAKDTGPGP
jgi:hypothetical protein